MRRAILHTHSIVIALCLFAIIPGLAKAQGFPGRYHRYLEMRNLLSSLRDTYPQIAKLDTIGYSTRLHIPILRMKISDSTAFDQDEPTAFIMGGAHANEVLGPEVVLGFAQSILQNYANGDQNSINLINSLEISLAPMINPEGHIVVENGNLDWRKNQCDNDSNGIFNFHDGVDNNRNYDIGWELANDPNATTPESSMYRGTAPFTQSENIAIADLSQRYRPVVALDYHSPAYGLSEAAYFPWYWRISDGGSGASPDEAMMSGICHQFASLIVNDNGDSTYRVQRGVVSEGDLNTYFYGNFGSVVFTVEVSDTTIQDPSMVDDIVARNIPSIYFLLNRALGGRITGVIRDSVTLEPLEAEVRVLERANPDINPRMSRPDFGRYDRILNNGTYTLGFLKDGYFPRQINGVVIGNTPVVNDVYLIPMYPRPPAPTLLYPSDGQILSENQFTLDWSDIDPASRYLIEISADSLFNSPVLYDSNITVSQFPLSSPLGDGAYFWRVKGGNENGWGPYTRTFQFIIDAQSAIDEKPRSPVKFSLNQNYPNPFNSETTISYSLESPSPVSVYIFSLNGQMVASPLKNIKLNAGNHQIPWNGRDSNNRELSSGIYFYSLTVDGKTESRPMIMLK